MRRRFIVLWSVVAATLVLTSPQLASAASIATWTLPDGFAQTDEVYAGGAVWSLSLDGEHGYLYKIDPATNTILDEIVLPPGNPSGNSFYPKAMVAGFGSLWVAMTWRDEVFRIDPVSGRIVRRVVVGRYPEHLEIGGGSIWAGNFHQQSVSRIDPATNTVVATIPVGRRANGLDGPWALTWDESIGTLLVTLPNTGRVAMIDGATQRIKVIHTDPAHDCGGIIVVPGGFWLDDSNCTGADMSRYDFAAGKITAHITFDAPDDFMLGGFASGGYLYTGELACGPVHCRHGTIVKRDATTGAVVRVKNTPSFATLLPQLADGDIWATDTENHLGRLGMF